jgi:hypothetical protein
MARGRLMSRCASLDEDLAACSIEAQLLHARMIPHLDDFGRLDGSPGVVRAQCVPQLPWSASRVEALLGELFAHGLIVRYRAQGRRVIAFPAFERHQPGLHKRTRSDWPGPDDPTAEPEDVPQADSAGEAPPPPVPEIPGHSGNFPDDEAPIPESPGTPGTRAGNSLPREPKGREGKGREQKSPPPPIPAEASAEERATLGVLHAIPGWVPHGPRDLALLRSVAEDYPGVALRRVAGDLAAWYADDPLRRGGHPRARFRTFVRKAWEWQRPPPARAAPPVPRYAMPFEGVSADDQR